MEHKNNEQSALSRLGSAILTLQDELEEKASFTPQACLAAVSILDWLDDPETLTEKLEKILALGCRTSSGELRASQKELSDFLKQKRKDKGLTVTAFAKKAEVQRSFLSRLLNHGKPPRERTGRKPAREDTRYNSLAEVMGLSDEEKVTFIQKVEALQDGNNSDDDNLNEIASRVVNIIFREHPCLRAELLKLTNSPGYEWLTNIIIIATEDMEKELFEKG